MLAYVAVLVAIAYLLFVYWRSVLSILSRHGPATLFAACMAVTGVTVQALNFRNLLNSPTKPPLRAIVHVWAIANLANYLGPFQPGVAVRLTLLKRQGVSVSASTSASLRQVHLSTWVAMGLASVGLFETVPAIRAIGGAGLVLFFTWPLLLALLRRWVLALAPRWRFLDQRRAGLTELMNTVPYRKLGLFVAQYLLIAVNVGGVYWAFGAPLAPQDALLVAIASVLATLVAVTPNSLGVQDALYGYVAHVGGLSVSEALTIALLFRIAHALACAGLLALTFNALRNPAAAPKEKHRDGTRKIVSRETADTAAATGNKKSERVTGA